MKMKIYKIIKQTSINDTTGERKERYVLVQTYSTFIERVINLFSLERTPFGYHEIVFNTIEEAREYKEKLENPITYTLKEEKVE